MNITEVKIRATYSEGRMRALVSITIDSTLAIHDIKVIEGPERYFVAMPSRREEDGTFRDIVHPISAESRKYVEDAILDAYEEHIKALEEGYNIDDIEYDNNNNNEDNIDDDNNID